MTLARKASEQEDYFVSHTDEQPETVAEDSPQIAEISIFDLIRAAIPEFVFPIPFSGPLKPLSVFGFSTYGQGRSGNNVKITGSAFEQLAFK